MTANLYPMGTSPHTIGYAALKYPELPPELPIPFGNQLGVLQRAPNNAQMRINAQLASQYLNTIFEYQYSDAPHLQDHTCSQYWWSDALCLLNWLSSNPDVAIRIAKHPKVMHDTIEKLLDPKIVDDMKACTRGGGSSFQADFGTMLQFVSTILLFPDDLPNPVHPRLTELVPRLRDWMREFRGTFIDTVASRLADQIANPDPTIARMMRDMQSKFLVCGLISCSKKKDMMACGKCKIQRYCCVEHQKADWKVHKKICEKGLVEEEST